jgi:integrase
MYALIEYKPPPRPWNKGKIVGPKPPLRPQEVWAIRIHLQMRNKSRDLALFNLAIDSKLRGCDLVRLTVGDVVHGSEIRSRAKIIQQKTLRPVQFEITDQTRVSLEIWISEATLGPGDFLFPSRLSASPHISPRQYARIVASWIKLIGLNPSSYGTHSMRRTKASLIYRRTKNLRAVQLLLGHASMESTIRYLGIEVDDALELAEQTEV